MMRGWPEVAMTDEDWGCVDGVQISCKISVIFGSRPARFGGGFARACSSSPYLSRAVLTVRLSIVVDGFGRWDNFSSVTHPTFWKLNELI